jgi:hypothetical protein
MFESDYFQQINLPNYFLKYSVIYVVHHQNSDPPTQGFTPSGLMGYRSMTNAKYCDKFFLKVGIWRFL